MVIAYGVAALAFGAAILVLACNGDDPPPSGTAAPAATPVAGAATVSFPAEDGVALDGRFFAANGDRLVVLLHMYPSDQTSWFPVAQHLQEQGYPALTFDFRGYGLSDGQRDGNKNLADLHGALTWAATAGYQRVALVGASMGGTAAIVAAAAPEMGAAVTSIDGVLTLSAPSEFLDIDALAVVADVDVPLWTLAAEGDTSAAHAAETFQEAAAMDEDSVHLFSGLDHGTDLLTGDHHDEVYTLLGEFLAAIWP